MKKEKTIFVTISEGFIARNILRTDFLGKIKKNPGVRLVILTPGSRDKDFRREFESQNVIIEDLPSNEYRAFRENLFNTLHSHLVFTETSHIKLMDRIAKNRLVAFKYILRKINSFFFGRFRFIRVLLSYLDRVLLPDRANKAVFEKYKPDLVFVPNLMVRRDFDVLKRALSMGIKTVGMPRSWDNLVKDIPMRVRPHKMVVWNEIMKDQAVHYQHYDKDDIYISGIPQFDIYEDTDRFSDRESFIRGIGGDPSKRVLLFAGAGRWTPNDPDIVKMIQGFISQGKLVEPCQLFVRPHFAWEKYIKPLTDLSYLEGVIVDTEWSQSDIFPDGWDPAYKDMMRLAESLYHADILITSFSTIVIDMAYFNKPIINIAFDGYEKKKPRESMARWYSTRYYKDVVARNGTRMVRSEEELLEAINRYLQDPSHEKEGRKKLREQFCYKFDGKAGERVADYILSEAVK